MNRAIIISAVVLSLFLTGCGQKESKESSRANTVAVILPTRVLHQDMQHADGTVESTQDTLITSEIPGKITKIAFNNGEAVKAGQLLFQLNSKKEEAALEGAKAKLAYDQKNLEATRGLRQGNVITPKNLKLQLALEAIAADKADIASLIASLNLTQIRAPFSGTLTARQFDLGAYVQPGVELVRLIDLKDLIIFYQVPQTTSHALKIGDRVPFEIAKHPEAVHYATITFISSYIDPITRGVLIQAKTTQKGNALLPGMFVLVNQPSGGKVGLKVPMSALLTDANGQYIYIAKEGHARMMRVKAVLGENDSVVLLGLRDTDLKVIYKGAQNLTNGAPIIIAKRAV